MDKTLKLNKNGPILQMKQASGNELVKFQWGQQQASWAKPTNESMCKHNKQNQIEMNFVPQFHK